MEIQEVKTAAENAMKAFEALKTDILPLKKQFEDLDGETKGKFAKMEKAVADAIEVSQKAAGERKALEDQIKALETAFNRPGAASSANDEKAMAQKCNKLFNDFARQRNDENKQYFDSFVGKHVTDEVELKALSVASDPNGGYLVMPTMGGVIQTKVYESSPIRQLADVIVVGTDSYEVILDNDEAASGWVGETQARNDTNNPTLGKLVIPVNEMYAQPKATQKILDDAGIDMEAWLAGKVSVKFARDEATAFVSGNGVLKPKGILSYAAGTDINQQQIEQVNSGSAGAFAYDGLVNLQNSLKEPYQANAVFLYQRTSNASIMKIKDGEDRPIFNMTYDKNVGLQPTLMGKPVYFAADMPSVASAALAAAYGDFREAYQVVDRAGIRVLRDPFTDKPNIKFYTTKRVGGAVKNFEAIKLHKLSA